jgi:hypothetical protein
MYAGAQRQQRKREGHEPIASQVHQDENTYRRCGLSSTAET